MEIDGLPLHILLIHAVVILIPLAALCVVLHAVWPVAGRRLGVVTPILTIVATILVPITTNAGEWLQVRVAPTSLVAIHAALGKTLLPWAIALSIVALIEWVWFRFATGVKPAFHAGRGLRTSARIILIVLALIVATGTIVTTIQIGESGARAVWSGSVKGG